ncbi:ATP-binding cassette domain-containing protein [Novispirillum itersonii]|uniref:ATP-binding cassette domain-containing protein n=1 Tax=Novispirillum itersonii TaxID=189 RepID=UPI002892DCFC|nr:ATP-binding cassette domain-containing protein [Novispirillum itersonii]
MRTPVHLQNELTECALTALAILLDHYGTPVPLETLRHQSGLCQDGTTAVDLLRLARQHGLEAKAYSRDIDGLAALGFPLIVQTDFNHMVVVETVSPAGIRVNDPASGPAVLPLSEFSERFTGIVIVLRPAAGAAPPRRRSIPHSGILRRAGQRIRRNWGPLWQALPPTVRHRLTAAIGAAVLLTLLPAGLIATAGTAAVPTFWVLGLCLVCLCARTLLLARAAPATTAALRDAAIATLCRQPGRYFSMRGPDRLFAQMNALIFPAECLGGRTGGRGLDLLLIPACLSAVCRGGSLTTAGLATALILLAAAPVVVASQHRTARWRKTDPQPPRLSGLDGLALTRDTGWAFSGQRAALWASLTGSAAQSLTDSHRAGLSLLRITAGCLLAMALTAVLGVSSLLSPVETGLILLTQTLLWRLAEVLPDLVALQRTASTLVDLLTGPPPAALSSPLRSVPGTEAPPLAIDDLSFGYRPQHPPLLAGLSLTLTAGEQVSLTGPSGAGKSTLLRLIAGLDQPWSGSRIAPDRLALLSEEETFPAGSLRDCLTLSGAIPGDDEALRQVLRRAEAWDFVLPRGGLSMPVPDGATCFSGGQRRRLTLARALLTAPTLLLIDEAFDSLDPDLEARIRHTLRQDGITLLTVTQRPASLRLGDRAVVLTADGLTEWSDTAGQDTLATVAPPDPDAPPVFPRPEHRPLPAEDLTVVRQTVQALGGTLPASDSGGDPEGDPGPVSGDPLRATLHQNSVLTRRVRLRPQDRLDHAAEPLLIQCGGRWRFLSAPERVSPPPAPEALSVCRLHHTAPSTTAPLRSAGVRGLLLCLPALLAGLLIQTGADAGAGPLLLLSAAAAAMVPLAVWLRGVAARSQIRTHATLWSWLLFLPLTVLRRGQADRLDEVLPHYHDHTRIGVPAILTLPPLLVLALTGVYGTPAAPGLAALAGLTLGAALWAWRHTLIRSEQRTRIRRSLAATVRTLTGLRLLGVDRAALNHWHQQQQRLDRARHLPDLLVSLMDLSPVGVGLAVACGLWLPPDLPATALLPVFLLLSALSVHGGGLGAALHRPAPLFPGTDGAPPTALPPPPFSDSPVTLTADSVVYTLPGASSPLIGPSAFTLTLRPGTVTALCGPSGCGKTTLTRLLTGILTPESGSIRLNGIPVTEASRAALQARIGWLEQDDSLPVGTVRAHVSGNRAATEAECWQALEAVGMAEAVAALPMGLQAVISSQTLPAGQVRLLHLARVMLTRPAVLILDEALSGLETGRLPGLLAMIRQSGCACLLITHRPDILPLNDAAWEIHDGQVRPVNGGGLTPSTPNSAAPYPASGH